eukprot:TRINITY_DN4317_c0_g1_i1.p1 TRINITY_DN4317_c0_g1~~TRINITY_DN4317_c0_g1_i1.p1  ORF type:complete len:110 (+),score=22.34 TRINITY_DN4317_c0_g1_i1:3-332(+)
MSAESEIAGKTFVYRSKATAPFPQRFEFNFGKDHTFTYASHEAPELPVVSGSGEWALEGKKIKLTWQKDEIEAQSGDNFSDLYTDLKFTKCGSVKSKSAGGGRKFMEQF